jgi:energy-coupling factor transport system ATP-binding protein
VPNLKSSVSIDGLTVRYSDAQSDTLQDITLTLPAGARLGLVGKNGSGKSTLAYSIIGIVPEFFPAQVSGEIQIDDHRLASLPIARRLDFVGYSFQDVDSQILFGTVRDILGLKERSTDVELVELAIDLLELQPMLGRLPDQLSGGQAQRLALTAALRRGPKLVLYDEATTALDLLGRDRFCKLVQLLSERGHTLVLIGQRTKLLAPYAERMAVLSERQLIFGASSQLLSPSERLDWKAIWTFSQQTVISCAPVAITFSNVVNRRRGIRDFIFGPISLFIDSGQIVALVGPNGSGKSTLFELVLGTLRPQKGEICFALNYGIITDDVTRTRPGLLFQNPSNQLVGSTIREELSIAFGSKSSNQLAEFIDLLQHSFPYLYPERDPLELSYGQQKILGLVDLMGSQHGLLLLDEPEQGLDEEHVLFFQQWLIYLRERRSSTVLFATHDLEIASFCADRVLLLEHGRVIKDYKNPSLEQLIEGFNGLR